MVSRIEELEQRVQSLHAQLISATKELQDSREAHGLDGLRSVEVQRLHEKHREENEQAPDHDGNPSPQSHACPESEHPRWPLSMDEYTRYSRQLIMPEIGLRGQLQLKSSSALIIGLGGLGSPALAYLCGAGIGTLGLLDGDTVSVSNLHRQVVHTTSSATPTTPLLKTSSAADFVKRLNPHVATVTHPHFLTPENAVEIVRKYDIVLDCSDTPSSRYLVSDACVIALKPYIFGSALRMDGQLMVLNDPPLAAGATAGGGGSEGDDSGNPRNEIEEGGEGGPCYRCVFPTPPPRHTQPTCAESGILGPVVGTIGVLMALEAIRLLTRHSPPPPPPPPSSTPIATAAPAQNHKKKRDQSMHIFTALSPTPFRTIKLRPTRRPHCPTCSPTATITSATLAAHHSSDATDACSLDIALLRPDERISAREFANRTRTRNRTRTKTTREDNGNGNGNGNGNRNVVGENSNIIIDLRDPPLFELYNLPGSVNMPYSELAGHPTAESVLQRLNSRPPPPPTNTNTKAAAAAIAAAATPNAAEDTAEEEDDRGKSKSKSKAKQQNLTLICAQGNDSQLGVRRLRELGVGGDVVDVVGGWRAWRRMKAAAGEEWPDL